VPPGPRAQESLLQQPQAASPTLVLTGRHNSKERLDKYFLFAGILDEKKPADACQSSFTGM